MVCDTGRESADCARREVVAMTSGTTPSGVARALRQSPYPLIAFDLEDLIILGANEAACELLGRSPNSLDGVSLFEILSPVDQPKVEAARALLASGATQGYRALRHFRKADGTEFEANVWVRLTTTDDADSFGLTIIERGAAAVPWPLFDASITIAAIVTDHEWTIELVSSDIERILGRSPEDFKGSPLLGMFQAADVQNFLSAVARVTADESKATLRMHVRDGDADWRDVWCMVVTMCQHSPPRLGLAIAAISEFGLELTSELHRQLAVLGGDVLDGMDQFRSHMPSGNFSTRQWEILTRLIRGERVEDIAADLYLSPSTVRNHLSAIYKKFGVHSQTQLLAKLLSAPD
jgi:PAS domain S-box-containing protein